MSEERQFLIEALEEIAKGEGEYSRTPLIHATNTIESMKAIARAALSRVHGEAEAGKDEPE